MALINKMEVMKMERTKIHTPVEARCAIFEENGEAILQINTYGSETREIQGAASQTIQFNKQSIMQLKELISSIVME